MRLHEALILGGHATTQPPQFLQPMTTSGEYQATNGFWYYCSWSNRLPVVRKVGYSAEYLNLKAEFEAHHAGLSEQELDQRWEKCVRCTLLSSA